jgi:sulfite exporter TauE/SafE
MLDVQNLAMFVGGLLGSAHCIGMCGGFAVTVGSFCPRMPAGLTHQAIYSAGRIFTYGFLGAMTAWAGSRLGGSGGLFSGAQQAMAIVAGVLMIGLGVSTLGLIPFRRIYDRVLAWILSTSRAWRGHLAREDMGCKPVPRREPQAGGRPDESLVTSVGSPQGVAANYDTGMAASFFGHFLRPTAQRGVFLAGVFTGFLPCGLVYAFLALAASTGNPLAGWLGMACFGLGTVPAMVLTGCGGAMVTARWRARVQRVAAVFVIGIGAVTFYRGVRQGPCHGAVSSPDCCEDRAPMMALSGDLAYPPERAMTK